jgi:hypothetical protein
MGRRPSDPVIKQVIVEGSHVHETRQHLFVELEKKLERPVVTFFTSFTFPVMIEDGDVDMLVGLLQDMDLSKGFALVVSSPGGSGLAAERIVNACRSYSGTGEYWAIVPGKAKSAATVICFGASNILMGPASELGCVDPQLAMSEDGVLKRFSVYNIVKSYRNLFSRAVKARGNLQPYLQQLQNYDEREIEELKSALSLSEDIAVQTLATGMMKRTSKARIKKKIKVFVTPEETKTHGRPIYREEARRCGIAVTFCDVKSATWKLVYELYIRTNMFVSKRACKCIESRDISFSALPPAAKRKQGQ